MRFTNSAALWLGLLAVPIVLLHILRPRRQTVVVSSVLLWRALARPVSAASPWQRLRPSLLLLAQLLAVAGLVIAAAGPVRVTDAPLAPHTAFVIDVSGSMAARDGPPDRLAAARARAAALRDELPDGAVASIVVAGREPRVVLTASANREAFDAALRALEVEEGDADVAAAADLAASLETPGVPLGVVLVSDGGLSPQEQTELPPGTRYERVGEAATNRAITHLSVERRGAGLHAVAAVTNTGGPRARQTLRFDVDGRTAYEVLVDVGPGATREVEADLPDGDRVEAFLEGEDLLAADDHAYAVAPARHDLRVLVAGPANPFLDLALQALGRVSVTRVDESVPATGYDLAIYDRVPVPADPGAPFLAIAAPSGVPGVTVSGVVARPVIARVDPTDRLTAGLDVADVAIATAQRLVAPGAHVLLGAEDAPLLVRGAAGPHRFVALAFALADSNLPVQVAFPVLVDRIVTELAGLLAAPASLVVGSPLPVDGTSDVVVRRPGGARLDVPAGLDAPVADRSGFWQVERDGEIAATVAVNVDTAESTLAPAERLLIPLPDEGSGTAEAGRSGERSILSAVIVVLLVVLAAEWLLSRRQHGVGRRQWRLATALRIAVAVALLGALAGLAISRPARHVATVFVVDASDSVGQGGRAEALDFVDAALRGAPRSALAGVVVFGGDARVERTVQEATPVGTLTVRVDREASDLAGALRLAAAVVPSDARRRVVLLSDGRPTSGDVRAAAARLATSGVTLEVRPLAGGGDRDVAVSVEAPARAHAGEEVAIVTTIEASHATDAVVQLRRNGVLREERAVRLEPGEQRIELRDVVGDQGVARYQVEVRTDDDSVAENDRALAATLVEGVARVLVVGGSETEGAAVAGLLRAGGLAVDAVPASSLPPLDELAGYASIVLADVDARSLAPVQRDALVTAVRDLGRGLVTIGGVRSYGLGGYRGSDLEELLPVVSEVLDPQRRQTVAEVLAIDTSGSMGACHCADGAKGIAGRGNMLQGGVEKTDIARAGAARAIAALNDNDEVGVLAFDTDERWLVDLQQLPPEEVVTSGLRKLRATGAGTDVSRTLSEAADALRGSHAALKHVVLFTDGFTAPGALAGLAEDAEALRAEGITVSVLATGEGAAAELAAVAEAGGGRFYPGRDLHEIPEIMAEEAVLASRDFIVEGRFAPEITGSGAAVDGLEAAPAVLGYVATTAKPLARTLLRIGPDRDPLLATWQAGLGRVASWTSDAGVRWTQTWNGWDGAVPFWSAVVKDTFPADSGAVSTRLDGSALVVEVAGAGTFPAGSDATAQVTGPDGVVHELTLQRAAGDVFRGQLPVEGAGTYAVSASVRAPDGTAVVGTALASRSYSAEYAPGRADPALLTELSARTGGRGAIEPAQAFDVADLPAGTRRVELTPWLLLAAAVAFVLAAALARLSFTGTAASSAASSVATAVTDHTTVVLERLRRGRSGSARRRPASPPAPARSTPLPPPAAAAPLPPPERPAGAEPAPPRPPPPSQPQDDRTGSLDALLASQRRRRERR